MEVTKRTTPPQKNIRLFVCYRMFLCESCGHSFSRKDSLARHKRESCRGSEVSHASKRCRIDPGNLLSDACLATFTQVFFVFTEINPGVRRDEPRPGPSTSASAIIGNTPGKTVHRVRD